MDGGRSSPKTEHPCQISRQSSSHSGVRWKLRGGRRRWRRKRVPALSCHAPGGSSLMTSSSRRRSRRRLTWSSLGLGRLKGRSRRGIGRLIRGNILDIAQVELNMSLWTSSSWFSRFPQTSCCVDGLLSIAMTVRLLEPDLRSGRLRWASPSLH